MSLKTATTSSRRTSRTSRARTRRVQVIALTAALLAAAAPVSLTGSTLVDAAERAALTALVVFVAAHGHRWSWIVAGIAITAPASGWSLLIAAAGLALAGAATLPRRRPKELGAGAVGLLVLAILWYPPSTPTLFGYVGAGVGLVLLVSSGMPQVHGRHRPVAIGAIVASVLVALLGVGLSGYSALSAAPGVEDGTRAAKQALAAARRGDAEAAGEALDAARSHFEAADSHLNGPASRPGDLVPGLAQQMRAVRVAVREGLDITRAADDLVASADYDDLRYQGRLDLPQVLALQDPAEHVRRVLDDARANLDATRATTLVPPLRDRIDEFADEVADAQDDAQLAHALLDTAPDLFGASGQRRYLVMFLTPAELRGAGGFVGSYAELVSTDGDIELTRSGRIDDLIEAAPPGTRTLAGPEEYLRRYGRLEPADYLQDTTYSPHFPSDASVLAQLYPQSGGQKVDGVISVDPAGLAALLELTGPVTVEGLDTPLKAADAEDLLLRRQYLELGDRAARGEILAAATKATFQELTEASLPSPRTLGRVLGPAVRGRHIQLWSPRRAEQQLFRQLHAAGELDIAAGSDGFALAQQNLGNNKIDAYLHRRIAYDVTVDARTGALDATLRITLRNDVPAGGGLLPDAVAANTRGAPRGTNVTTLSLFTPHRLTSATLDGKRLRLGPDTEEGLNVWDTPQLRVPPGGSITLVLHLKGGLDLRTGYDLRILPQPQANADQVEARVRLRGGRLTGPGTVDGELRRRGELREPLDLAATPSR
jgi:hypothetical protein